MFCRKVILSNGALFECSSDQSILDAEKINKIAIEYSCSTGHCGVCVAPLVGGTTKLIEDAISLLLYNGWRRNWFHSDAFVSSN